MTDIFTKKVVWNIDYFQLDKFINDNFPLAKGKFEILAHEELDNDTIFEVNVDSENYLVSYLNEQLEDGNLMYKTADILNILAREGKLPFTKGVVLVDVSY